MKSYFLVFYSLRRPIMNNLQEKVIRAMVDMYGFYSIEELSEMTEISISSIKRSLKDITKFIEDYDGKLLRVPKKGICMVVTDQQRENILEALDSYANGNPESFYYRKNYILDILFNYPANYTVQLFSEELCVSRKMIEKDLKMIEEYLATFHLELSKVQNQGISIVGREFDIRQAIVDTQNKKYWKHTYIEELPQELDYRISKRAFTYFSDYYSKEDIMMVQEYLADSEAELGVVLVDISFCRLTEYLLLTKRRMEEGNKIRNKADRTMTKLDDIYVETAKKILDRMFPHEDEMELEYQFLAAKFAVAKTCEVEAEIQDDYLMNIAEDYIYTVFMAMEKESTYHYRELEKQIATFLKKISIRHDYMLVEWDDLHKDVQQQIQSSYAVCLTYSFHLEEKLGFVLTQDEIAWLALLIHQASMETGSEKQGIFVMATDPYSAKYEAMKIENEISNLEIIKIVHIHDFKPELTKGKLVISTVPLKEKRNNVIEITKHVTQLDINKIISQMDEIAWLALLIHQASMETGSEKQGIFVMATDPYSAKYEAMKIENEISNLEIIKIVHIHDFKPELTKGKLVISTVPLKEKRNNVIEITKHVTQLDINKIISQMDEYAQEMKNEQVIETVKKAFQKELIVIDALATTKKETIAQVSKLLLEQGCLSEDVTEKVFELEERRPTTIGSQIAMAHVYKDSVKKSGIAVMRMKYPVKWSRSSKVKLVFFLAINMEESNEILKLFKYLYALIDNKEDIQKILEANSSGEIYELLMEEFH